MPKKKTHKDIDFKYNLDRNISKRLSFVYQLLVPASSLQENIEKNLVFHMGR